MGRHILAGNPPVELTLKQSARARRISLRVSGLDGKVTLTVPRGVRDAEALSFAQTKADWLRAQMARQVEPVAVKIGAEIPVEGRTLRIAGGAGRSVRLTGETLDVPDKGRTGARVEAWLKERARARLVAASDRYAVEIGCAYSKIVLRDTRSRWGSCSADGRLMYSWRLIMAPGEVLDYVAAHEVAHLRELNHSPAYWAAVAGLMPGYAAPRRWLRENSAALHRFRFRD